MAQPCYWPKQWKCAFGAIFARHRVTGKIHTLCLFSRCSYVGNLSPALSETALHDVFAQHGEILEAKIIRVCDGPAALPDCPVGALAS